MRKLSTMHILCLVLSGILLLAIIPWPYGYYVLVRFVAMVIFGFMAFSFFSERKIEYAIIAGVLALLFQPFVKIALGREVWQVVDVVVGILLIVFVIYDRKRGISTVQRPGENNPIGDTNSYDVFISYAAKDYVNSSGLVMPNSVVSQILSEFSKAGITYWIDRKRLVGGIQFPSEIARQIKNAKVFVFLSSENSNSSQWTMNEIATASTYGKTIIPFLLDRTPYNSSIMIYIAGIHYIDYLEDTSSAVARLVGAVKAQLQ